MIRLGQTVTGTGRGVTYMWLLKDMNIYRKYSKKECYVVLGWKKEFSGWRTMYNGTLSQCRAFIGKEVVVNI